MAKREIPEINAGSMADIAFLLLIFFLMTTTMDSDTGLARTMPPPLPPQEDAPPPIRERNVFEVLINANNQLLVEKQPMALQNLREAAKVFIDNPANLATLPEKEEIEVPFFGLYPVTTKAVISLQNDRGTQYQMYLAVQNELQAAYNELREELAKSKFGSSFKDLNEEQQSAIRIIYPQKISEAEPRNVGGK